jgi:uncharacterized Zn finger protein
MNEKPINADDEPYLVCYKCGSFSVFLFSKQGEKRAYKCRDCGRVWMKSGGGSGKEK